MGLAPDENDNGPSFMTSLRNLTIINRLMVSLEMYSLGKGTSRITFGGYTNSSMRPYPSAKAPQIYWYDNMYDDKEWGTEMRNIYFDGVSLDDNNLTYAKIDSFS